MCQVGENTFEITIDVVNMVERKTTQSKNVKELRFSKNTGWSQFAYLKLRKTRSGFSIPLDFEIAKVACTKIFIGVKFEKLLFYSFLYASYVCSKYRLWLHVRTILMSGGASNQNPQSMFWIHML